jgi:hypothetical protein
MRSTAQDLSTAKPPEGRCGVGCSAPAAPCDMTVLVLHAVFTARIAHVASVYSPMACKEIPNIRLRL